MDAGDFLGKLPTAHLRHYQVCEHQMNRLRVPLCDLRHLGSFFSLEHLVSSSAKYSAVCGALW